MTEQVKQENANPEVKADKKSKADAAKVEKVEQKAKRKIEKIEHASGDFTIEHL